MSDGFHKRDPDNGMVIGEDDCHYATDAEAFYFGALGLCGCGRPNAVYALILDCLRAQDENILDADKIAEMIAANADLFAEFLLHSLDRDGLIEHGGSVLYPWLTDKGEAMLAAGPMAYPAESAGPKDE